MRAASQSVSEEETAKLRELNSAIACLQEQLIELQVHNGNMKLDYEVLESEYSQYKQMVSNQIAKPDEDLQSELDRKLLLISHKETDNAALRREIEEVAADIAEAEKLNKTFRARHEKILKETAEAQATLEKVRATEDVAKRQDDEIRMQGEKLSSLQNSMGLLRSEIEQLRLLASKRKLESEEAEKAYREREHRRELSHQQHVKLAQENDKLKSVLEVPQNALDHFCTQEDADKIIDQIQSQLKNGIEDSKVSSGNNLVENSVNDTVPDRAAQNRTERVQRKPQRAPADRRVH